MQIKIHHPYHFSQLGTRDNQEDCLTPKECNEDSRFFVVCDGVGGKDRGEVASQLVCQSMEYNLSNLYDKKGDIDVHDIISVVESAYQTLYSNRAVCTSMATTMTLMAITSEGVLLAHLGDSIIYQVRRGKGVIYRTKDHSLVQELMDKGVITEEEARNHPRKNAITKFLYVTNDKNQYFTPSVCLIRNIEPDDVFMLCTDGVYAMLDDKDIGELLTSEVPLSDRGNELAKRCETSDDNNTAFLIEVKSIGQNDGKVDNVQYDITQPRTNVIDRFLNFITGKFCPLPGRK